MSLSESQTRMLNGKSVLVVEDEAIISFLLEDMLGELGASEVRVASSVAQALALIDARVPDLAVLDVNLGGERAYPIAQRLEADGVPFVFTTGYGRAGLDPAWAAKLVVQKPFMIGNIADALHAVSTR